MFLIYSQILMNAHWEIIAVMRMPPVLIYLETLHVNARMDLLEMDLTAQVISCAKQNLN